MNAKRKILFAGAFLFLGGTRLLAQEPVLKGASFTGDSKNATYMTHAAGPGNGFDVGMRVLMEVR